MYDIYQVRTTDAELSECLQYHGPGEGYGHLIKLLGKMKQKERKFTNLRLR